MTLKETIKQYLDNRAQTDSLFATTYAKPNKNIDECCSYITSQAKKQASKGCAVISDDVVFGWAVHYYDEDDIKVGSSNSKAVVTQTKPEKESSELKSKSKTETFSRPVRARAKQMSNELSLFGDETEDETSI